MAQDDLASFLAAGQGLSPLAVRPFPAFPTCVLETELTDYLSQLGPT